MLNVNVSNLMIGQRKSMGSAAIQRLPAHLAANANTAPLPQRAIDMHGIFHGHNTVFANYEDAVAALIRICDQFPCHRVDFTEVGGELRMVGIRPPFLQSVIEMREVT